MRDGGNVGRGDLWDGEGTGAAGVSPISAICVVGVLVTGGTPSPDR